MSVTTLHYSSIIKQVSSSAIYSDDYYISQARFAVGPNAFRIAYLIEWNSIQNSSFP
jgi:hypothetical protein